MYQVSFVAGRVRSHGRTQQPDQGERSDLHDLMRLMRPLPPENQALKMALMKMEVDSVFKINPGRTMDATSIVNLVPPASEDLRVPAHK